MKKLMVDATALSALAATAVEVDVPDPAPATHGVGFAQDGADALANVRGYCYPVLGKPQFTDAKGQGQSDKRFATYKDRPELAKVPADTVEIVLRSQADAAISNAIVDAPILAPFSYTGELDGLSADAWVNRWKSQNGYPSGG